MARHQQGAAQQSPIHIHVQRYLKGVDYPADRDGLLACARYNGADPDIMEALEQLPEQDYETPAAVSAALGRRH
jgi:hypothetical protein